jgi:hypothetical protein
LAAVLFLDFAFAYFVSALLRTLAAALAPVFSTDLGLLIDLLRAFAWPDDMAYRRALGFDGLCCRLADAWFLVTGPQAADNRR